jgi:hypothetical protein
VNPNQAGGFSITLGASLYNLAYLGTSIDSYFEDRKANWLSIGSSNIKQQRGARRRVLSYSTGRLAPICLDFSLPMLAGEVDIMLVEQKQVGFHLGTPIKPSSSLLSGW